MNVPRFTWLTAIVLLFIFGLSQVPWGKPQDDRPNIVILIADDLGWNDLGAYGNEQVYTPHIDQLAQSGVRFTNAFLTTSSCSASRGSILTGKYPHSNGLVDLHQALPEQEITLGEPLRQAGYFVGSVGKWHLGGAARSQFDLVVEDRSDSGTTRWLETLQALPSGRPFFLWMGSRDPHLPHTRGQQFESQYAPAKFELPNGFVKGMGVRPELLRYYLEVSSFDADVGLVVGELERQGLLDNTVVIVMSDNGRPFHRNKLTLYDDGIKTPFIIHWPRGLAAPSDYEHLISAIDIAPTVLDIAGVEIPQAMQGVSFAAALNNRSVKIRDYVFAERNKHGKPAHERAVRSRNFLYKENQFPPGGDCHSGSFQSTRSFKALKSAYDSGMLDATQRECFTKRRALVELFAVSDQGVDFRNLAQDPDFAEVRRDMAQRLHEWRRSTADFDFRPEAPPGQGGQ